jgi:hypothetical protein
LAAAALCAGCTTVALKRDTLRQAGSSADLRYHEVVENLAMIAANPAFLPSYSSIYAGTTDVSDTIQLSSQSVLSCTLAAAGRSVTVLATETLDVPSSRTIKENWTLDPVIVPEKLVAMRCACRWVLFGPGHLCEGCAGLRKYQPGDPPNYYFDVADKLAGLPSDWLHVGKCGDVPRNACYQANCHGTYVWVTPDGMEGLSQFTLILQGLARVALESVYFPQPATRTLKLSSTELKPGDPKVKTVTVYVDAQGLLTPGAGMPAVQRKVRVDNVGKNAELRSIINATRSP